MRTSPEPSTVTVRRCAGGADEAAVVDGVDVAAGSPGRSIVGTDVVFVVCEADEVHAARTRLLSTPHAIVLARLTARGYLRRARRQCQRLPNAPCSYAVSACTAMSRPASSVSGVTRNPIVLSISFAIA